MLWGSFRREIAALFFRRKCVVTHCEGGGEAFSLFCEKERGKEMEEKKKMLLADGALLLAYWRCAGLS